MRTNFWAAVLLISAAPIPRIMARENVDVPVTTRTLEKNRARLQYLAKPSRRCKSCGDEADTEVMKWHLFSWELDRNTNAFLFCLIFAFD
jgi:hypothetical protein